MDPETIVITGGAGFVGRHLVTELIHNRPGTRLVIWDRDVAGLPAECTTASVDLLQPETYLDLLKQLQPQWVVHLAAIAAVPAALKDPELVFRVNTQAAVNLLENIEAVSPKTKVVAVSSADIYGRASKAPLLELPLAEAHPENPYAESKLKFEEAIEERFNDRVLRVRPFPHIGPGQALGFVTADFASQIASIEAGRQEAVVHVGNLEARRDFTDVRDVVRAYRLLLEKGELGEVYHVASGQAVSIKKMLDMLLSFSIADITVKRDPKRLRPSDVPVLVGDAGKLRRATGWQPVIPFEQSLRDILDYWREALKHSA